MSQEKDEVTSRQKEKEKDSNSFQQKENSFTENTAQSILIKQEELPLIAAAKDSLTYSSSSSSSVQSKRQSREREIIEKAACSTVGVHKEDTNVGNKTLRKKACIVKLDNCHFTIVANTAKVESSESSSVKGRTDISNKNSQSFTVLKKILPHCKTQPIFSSALPATNHPPELTPNHHPGGYSHEYIKKINSENSTNNNSNESENESDTNKKKLNPYSADAVGKTRTGGERGGGEIIIISDLNGVNKNYSGSGRTTTDFDSSFHSSLKSKSSSNWKNNYPSPTTTTTTTINSEITHYYYRSRNILPSFVNNNNNNIIISENISENISPSSSSTNRAEISCFLPLLLNNRVENTSPSTENRLLLADVDAIDQDSSIENETGLIRSDKWVGAPKLAFDKREKVLTNKLDESLKFYPLNKKNNNNNNNTYYNINNNNNNNNINNNNNNNNNNINNNKTIDYFRRRSSDICITSDFSMDKPTLESDSAAKPVVEVKNNFCGGTSVSGSGSNSAVEVTYPMKALQSCFIRLKNLRAKLENDQPWVREELINELEFAAVLSENICFLENSLNNNLEDDDVLGVVESDSVPDEVRDWLTLTFTRTNPVATKERKSEDKLKFRSVANAIRAGIMVDKIYRRTSSLTSHEAPPEVDDLLKNMDDWSFDIFALNETSEWKHALKYMGQEVILRYDLVSKFKIGRNVLDNFLTKLEHGYSKFSNPYHNLVHAADVTQTVNYIISQSDLTVWMSDLEIFAILFSALIHDYEHTGTTNAFHVNTNSEYALIYNDRSVLENYHLSSSFKLLKDEDCNVLAGLKTEEYKEFRKLVVDIVLATDMSNHFQQIKNIKSLIPMPENLTKAHVFSLIVHCSDISHPSKTWKLHKKWTELLLEEFFLQGDREAALGHTVSPLCDRNNTLVAESQIGFIDFIVEPTLTVMADSIEALMNHLQRQLTVETSKSKSTYFPKDKTKPETITKPEMIIKQETLLNTDLVIVDRPISGSTEKFIDDGGKKNSNENEGYGISKDEESIFQKKGTNPLNSNITPRGIASSNSQRSDEESLSQKEGTNPLNSNINSQALTLLTNLKKSITSKSSAVVPTNNSSPSITSTSSAVVPTDNSSQLIEKKLSDDSNSPIDSSGGSIEVVFGYQSSNVVNAHTVLASSSCKDSISRTIVSGSISKVLEKSAPKCSDGCTRMRENWERCLLENKTNWKEASKKL